MRLVVPYTKRLPEVVAALPDAEWIDVAVDDFAYWRLLYRLWSNHEAFTIVEHDIVPAPDLLAEIRDCPEEWCAAGYAFEDFGLIYGLGCVKFAASLTERVPAALGAVAAMETTDHPARHWCSLDDRLSGVLRRAGVVQHHHGEVRHLLPVRSHDC